MAKLIWNRTYRTRIGIAPHERKPGQPGTIELKPGTNELDDETLQQLQKTPGFSRLTKAGYLQIVDRTGRDRAEREAKMAEVRARRATTTEPRATEARPPADAEQTGRFELPQTEGRLPWNRTMSRERLAAALQSRGVEVEGMSKNDLLEALDVFDQQERPER